jgi:hypothetical protein
LENALGDTDASSRLGIKLTWRSLPKVFSGGNCGIFATHYLPSDSAANTPQLPPEKTLGNERQVNLIPDS